MKIKTIPELEKELKEIESLTGREYLDKKDDEKILMTQFQTLTQLQKNMIGDFNKTDWNKLLSFKPETSPMEINEVISEILEGKLNKFLEGENGKSN